MASERIGGCAAVHAGVEVGLGAADFDLGVDHAAQTDAKSGQAGSEEFGVGDEGEVGLEVGGLDATYSAIPSPPTSSSPSKRTRTLRGRVLLAASKSFESFDLHPDLAFVIDGAAGVDVAVALGGLEGRREPFVDGVGGLDVVVAVDEDGRLAEA